MPLRGRWDKEPEQPCRQSSLQGRGGQPAKGGRDQRLRVNGQGEGRPRAPPSLTGRGWELVSLGGNKGKQSNWKRPRPEALKTQSRKA